MSIKRYISTAVFLGIASVLLLFNATTASEFNPNYVISDEALQDWRSMDQAEIQAFLEGKDSFLATHTTPDVHDKSKIASTIIYEAAREYQISPKFILVMLQKEMSLVTATNPTDRQLDFAAGYAVCDSCSFSDPQVLKYKGFGKQIDAVAGIMRWYYDNVKTEAWIKQPLSTYQIDTISVSPANFATGFMYTYTPHIEGNKNFWTIWQQWFDQVYPDGTLLKTFNEPEVYLLQNGKKRLVKSMTALLSRFDPKTIIEVPASELARYSTGSPLTFSNYSILKNNGTYYLLDFDTLRPFENKNVFASYGYNPQEVIDVTDQDIADYYLGEKITKDERAPSGRIIKLGSNLYFIQAQTYYPILDLTIATIKFPGLDVEDGTSTDFEGLERGDPLTFPNATLMGDSQTGNIYVIENGKRRHITSELVFLGLGYKWENVIWVDPFVIDIHKMGESVYLRTDTYTTSPAPPEAPTEEESTTLEKQPTTNANELEFIPQTNAPLPITFPETGKMLRTPESYTTYIGEKYSSVLDAYLVADTSGTILAAKNVDVVRPMASFTKVMTAYRLFYEGLDLNRTSVYNKDKHKALYHGYRISVGEGVKNRDLLRAMLVSSRNTPARMLVGAVETDESRFISRMNAQAHNWGLTQTHFTDTYGYDLGNQTTARDYLRLFKKGIQNTTIHNTLALDSFSYREEFDLDNQPDHAGVHTNALQRRSDLAFDVVASKTGYLYESGYNHAMLITRKSDGTQFYIISMGYPEFSTRHQGVLELTNWAITTF